MVWCSPESLAPSLLDTGIPPMKASIPFFLLAPLVFTGLTFAQQQVDQPQSPHDDGVYTTRIEVKLAEGTGAILVDGRLQSRKGVDLSGVAAIFAKGRAERLITLPLATLDAWHAETRDGEAPLPDHLGLWFRVTGADAAATKEILAALQARRQVQTAYRELQPDLPGGKDIAPPTPNWEAKQDYAEKPPLGVNADLAHTILGGRGRGIIVTDMEVTWTGEHEDLLAMDASDVWLGRKYIGSSGHHGTAVAGEIVADRNAWGMRGISDMVKYHVSSWNDGGVASAISRGVNAASRGDIVLLEVHYRTSVGYVPAEAIQSNYNVIIVGTRRGIHICEAAGNGNLNLNTLAYGGPRGYLDPTSSNFRDSGAIMIGATNGEQLVRAGFSNYGRRITANGWGYRVYTTGYGTLFRPNNDLRQYYTLSFSGTSSASPIVTATVACLVGAKKFQDDTILTVNEVRNLLRKHGTPCTGSIGKRPDLVAMLKDIGLPDGLSQSREAYRLGDDYELALSSPTGGVMALFVCDTIGKVDLGFNRKFHLDMGRMIHVGNFKLPRSLKIRIPNDPTLKNSELFLQGVSVDTANRLRASSSTQVWIR